VLYCPNGVRSCLPCKPPVYLNKLTRRAWAAFRRGAWQTVVLLRLWQAQIEGLPGWQVQHHERYRAITVDVTAVWHPRMWP